MHLELLVEEASMEAALLPLIPKILPEAEFAIRVHGGKADLLEKLPGWLRGYHYRLPEDWRIVVLLDEDREPCHQLKAGLEQAARRAGLRTRSTAAPGQGYQVINRLAIEELEAWFFGDVPALAAAYPRVSLHLGKQAKYRDPDAIAGGTWEALERVLQRAGYYPEGLAKIEVAATVSRHMEPERNRSRSFQVFRDALRALTAKTTPDTEEE